MSKTVITIEHLECGQKGACADFRINQYRALIKAERHGVYIDDRVVPACLTEDEVKQLARGFVHNWASRPEWRQPQLKNANWSLFTRPIDSKTVNDEQQASEWEVLIVQPFLD